MKNFTTGLNIALVLAVAVLFYLHFSSNKKEVVTAGATSKSLPSGNFQVAYFELDSIENQFEYYKEIRNALQAKDQVNNKQLNEMKNAFTARYQELQKAAQGMSQAELANKQQELMQMERTLQGKEQMMNQEMQEEGFRKVQDVKKKIEEYLKEYNKDKGYAYIISNRADLIYLKNTAYDITADLVKGLNELYKKK